MASIPLKGSERVAMPGARVVAPADPTERLEVSLIVRRGAGEEFRVRVAELTSGGVGRPCMSREEFAQRHGADPADFAVVRAFALAFGLTVVQEHAARRTVVLSGTVAQFNTAFHVQLQRMQHDTCSYRGRTGRIELPPELSGVVEAVLGLDNRPQAAAHFRIRPAASTASSFTPPQVASLYAFPNGTGLGECVALIELGGGFRPADLDTYFKGLSVASPTVTAVSVDHGQNSPTGDANGPDGEVMLDIEVVGAIAPQAKIAVYFAPNTDAGFLDAITTAIHDTNNKPSVISISWGSAESAWTSQAMTAMDGAFQAAATLGITVCVASGDNGSSDGVTDGTDHVDFPASSSFALACGGTSLRATPSAIGSEVVWNDGANGGASGGGISTVFARPAWQAALSAVDVQGKSVALTKRGVPDVAGNADPATGYEVRVDGTVSVIGGTSAVAPLWAALVARVNELAGKPAGFLNPQLYKNPQALRDITSGNNGAFAAASGWDACTGLGSPNGAALRAVI
ncbi:MAG: S53 family peptidase [Pseudomonadota bacterium]|nr:S53 family peptidase [Pseudomonadota bacterium]